jgi:hypothetical protein
MSKLVLAVWDHIPIWNCREDGDPHISGSVSSVLPDTNTTCTDSEFAASGQFLVEGSQR